MLKIVGHCFRRSVARCSMQSLQLWQLRHL